jgi:hypothetical protein
MATPPQNHELLYIISIYHKNASPPQLKCRLTFTDFYWKASFDKLKQVFRQKTGEQNPTFYRQSKKIIGNVIGLFISVKNADEHVRLQNDKDWRFHLLLMRGLREPNHEQTHAHILFSKN